MPRTVATVAASACLFSLLFSPVHGKTSSTTSSGYDFYSQSVSTLTTIPTTSGFTGSRYSYDSTTGQTTVNGSSSYSSSSFAANSTQSTRTSSKKHALTTIGGSGTQSSTTTSSAHTPVNTVPCNGWPEFCERSYSNITNVCAHNSAFDIKNNAGSNQIYGIRQQLNDGIRMVQGETHWVNNTVYNCHSTCKLLNAGPWVDSLEIVVDWLRENPYDVVTWLIVNSDFVKVENYLSAIEASGIREYLYEPKYIPQHRDQWPTLGEMILSNKRVVMFMDYNANQTAVPFILDEFTHMWETPFSPTNRSFPCTQQRPPGLSEQDARDTYMYLANHNLNTAVDLSALIGQGEDGHQQILIPNTAYINSTNGAFDQIGQVEATRLNCTRDWNRPPNFLLVDYYNFGEPRQGSVFEVAARANGVKYNWDRCCASTTSSSGPSIRRAAWAVFVAAVGFAVLFAW